VALCLQISCNFPAEAPTGDIFPAGTSERYKMKSNSREIEKRLMPFQTFSLFVDSAAFSLRTTGSGPEANDSILVIAFVLRNLLVVCLLFSVVGGRIRRKIDRRAFNRGERSHQKKRGWMRALLVLLVFLVSSHK
jgi:uncharacterized protein involved in response to NO